MLQQRFSDGVINRRYIFPYIPNGFWARLITRMLYFAEDPIRQGKSDQPSQCEYWQDGIFINWSSTKLFLITTETNHSNIFNIFTPATQPGYKLLGGLVDLIDNLVEEWYPGLSGPSVEHSGKLIQRLAPCYSCTDFEEPHFFSVEACIEASYLSDLIECPNCGPRLIHSIAPDAVFADFDRDLIYEDCQIEFQGTRKNILGTGSFASVYKAKVNGTNLAIKVFGDDPSASCGCPNRLLRQEVDILTRLNHPCLISIVGVSLRPRMLLLEYAPLGNLETTLKSGRGLSRGMQHRIALQISEGLAYLHEKNIVYRDLKPNNVLVFSLSMGMLINVKISDYGISQFTTLLGLSARRGTPGYQAPEIAQGSDGYSLEVDIFSFGVTLYEILTGGGKPFRNVISNFQHELDAAVLSNKPIESITSYGVVLWPDMEALIAQCLLPNPEQRPTAKAVRDTLLRVDLLCLKQEVAICIGQTVECVAMRRLSENSLDKIEVWVGSGEAGSQSQLSWLTLNTRKKQAVQGMLVKDGRILCMISYKQFIIVGTKEGLIIVYDANLKKRCHALSPLSDSVLCLMHFPQDMIVAGLADGNLVLYHANKLVIKDTPHRIISLTLDLDKEQQNSIACMNISRNHLLCGYGGYVLEVEINTFAIKTKWKVTEKRIVSSIQFSKSDIFITCKESSNISVWANDENHTLKLTIDCSEILHNYDASISQRDSRIVSMTIVDRSVLWVGCGSGHIILLDASPSTYSPLLILTRHTSAVRAITVTPRVTGTSASVITGGMGFRQLYNISKDVDSFGYVLVWEADLAKQHKHLECERKKREEECV